MVGSISNLTKGTLAFKYVEHDTIHPMVLICTAKCASIYIASSRHEHGRLYSMISISEVGRDRPTALEPKRIAWDAGNRLWMKKRTR